MLKKLLLLNFVFLIMLSPFTLKASNIEDDLIFKFEDDEIFSSLPTVKIPPKLNFPPTVLHDSMENSTHPISSKSKKITFQIFPGFTLHSNSTNISSPLHDLKNDMESVIVDDFSIFKKFK